MLNSILMVPGPPERLNKLKNRFFEKSENFKKLQKIAKICPMGSSSSSSSSIFRIFQKIGFLAYFIAPGVPGPLKSNSASKNTPRDLSTASDRGFFIDFRGFFIYFLVFSYENTIKFNKKCYNFFFFCS